MGIIINRDWGTVYYDSTIKKYFIQLGDTKMDLYTQEEFDKLHVRIVQLESQVKGYDEDRKYYKKLSEDQAVQLKDAEAAVNYLTKQLTQKNNTASVDDLNKRLATAMNENTDLRCNLQLKEDAYRQLDYWYTQLQDKYSKVLKQNTELNDDLKKVKSIMEKYYE